MTVGDLEHGTLPTVADGCYSGTVKDKLKYGESSEKSMEHHHRFAYSVTMFQISIALAAVAALSRKRMVWYYGLLVAVLGLMYFVDAFWLYF